jgi:hypothetical protein
VSEHVLDHLSAYLDGELALAEQERFRSHLAECAACATRLEQLASVDRTLRGLPAEAPAGYFEGLPAEVRSRLSQASAPRGIWRAPTWTLAAAAALLVGVLAPLTLRQKEAAAPAASVEQFRQPAASPGTLEADKLATVQEAKKRADADAPAAAPAKPQAFEQPRALGRAKLEAPQEKELAVVEPAAPATPPPARPAAPPPAAAPPSGFAEPPRQVAQNTQEFGPRASQQPELRNQTPPKSAAAQAEELTVRAEPRAADLKDAPAPAERGLTKSDSETSRRDRAAGYAASRLSASSGAYRDLLQKSPRDAAEARSLRESWRRFAATTSNAAEADEAQVRVVELGIAAWRYERRQEDQELARADAASYLRRQGAGQASRVRELLAALDK